MNSKIILQFLILECLIILFIYKNVFLRHMVILFS